MKCQKCGKDIPDGELICVECGAEVQLVPDYNSIEYMMQCRDNQEEKEKEYEKTVDRKMRKKYKKKKKKKHPVLIGMGILSMTAVLGLLIAYLIWDKNHNSFEYQYEKAVEAFQNQDYERASGYVERAIYLNPDHVEAELLSVEIILASGDESLAIESLKAVVYNHPDSEAAYAKLITLYEKRQDTASIQALMEKCENESVKEAFSEYICADPVFVTGEGNYTSLTEIEIQAEEGTVYYTTDGTIPDQQSQVYSGPFALPEGRTTVRAVAYNEKGIASNVISCSYTLTLETPDPPAVSPDSGVYEKGSKITVTVPAGCTAYYVFDKAADKNCNLYTEPVSMLNGEHIFSVVLVNENGKQSYPTTVTYVAE
ncbi:MAG: chitobiase/beta-hexosaminidase C-terminal domain-containing protein [Lachnospiraceae bacterium]|nr:chitobiase/beta-hexosaminidase C-terminal domain-containing protein [Lachnospiraceae bacterium]